MYSTVYHKSTTQQRIFHEELQDNLLLMYMYVYIYATYESRNWIAHSRPRGPSVQARSLSQWDRVAAALHQKEEKVEQHQCRRKGTTR